MPRPKQYPLNTYIKGVEKLAALKGFSVKVMPGGGSAVRFEVYHGSQGEIWDMWVIHTEHSKRREVWSKEDYRKPDRCLDAPAGEFLRLLEML